MTREEIREGIIQGVNKILLENLVRPRNITNYIEPSDIDEYREWLEDMVDKYLVKPMDSQSVVIKNKIDIPDEGLWMPGGWYIPKAACDALMRLAVEPLIKEEQVEELQEG